MPWRLKQTPPLVEDDLIDVVEAKLSQTVTETELFNIEWEVKQFNENVGKETPKKTVDVVSEYGRLLPAKPPSLYPSGHAKIWWLFAFLLLLEGFMKYAKKALTFEQQADLIISRGLVCDRSHLMQCLQAVNYYRLSAYWYTFRISGDPNDNIQPGTTLDTVWRRYRFDRQLRLLVMDAIERVEIAIRTRIVNRHVMLNGPFGYLDRATLPGASVDNHRKLLEKIRTEAEYSHEEFVRHYFDKYTEETDLPLWMASELLTFGGLLTIFNGLPTRTKKDVALDYGLNVPILGSWLRSLNQVRNICAHHSRLWNREFGIKPLIPYRETFPEWHKPVTITDERLFGIMTVLYFLLKQVAPQSAWRSRLVMLFDQYKDIPKRFMGFPDNWQDSPIWK